VLVLRTATEAHISMNNISIFIAKDTILSIDFFPLNNLIKLYKLCAPVNATKLAANLNSIAVGSKKFTTRRGTWACSPSLNNHSLYYYPNYLLFQLYQFS
jgi:hypothetical protein